MTILDGLGPDNLKPLDKDGIIPLWGTKWDPN